VVLGRRRRCLPGTFAGALADEPAAEQAGSEHQVEPVVRGVDGDEVRVAVLVDEEPVQEQDEVDNSAPEEKRKRARVRS
jgi:hypothetical protein